MSDRHRPPVRVTLAISDEEADLRGWARAFWRALLQLERSGIPDVGPSRKSEDAA